MNKKLTFTAAVLAGLMLGAGATVIADNFWQGHQNIVETRNNIDKLVAKINDLTSQLEAAKQKNKGLSQAIEDAQSIKDYSNNIVKSVSAK